MMITHEGYHNPVRMLYLILFFLTAICIALPQGVAQSGDLPAFRKGMWEFNRTMEGAGSQENLRQSQARNAQIQPRT